MWIDPRKIIGTRNKWRRKVAIMRICAKMPFGDRLYRAGQKCFCRLKPNPMSRLPAQGEIARWFLESGRQIDGSCVFEVGTGHLPAAPIGFFLCGARSVITVDLHRRMEWDLTRESLNWIAAHRDEVFRIYQGMVDEALFDKRFGILTRFQHDPVGFFRESGIEYLAPMDAAHTDLPENSIDCHFSITVLEHIPKGIIKSIFLEAKRVLKLSGAAIHFVDLSDLFQHQDKSITRINFLKYSNTDWERIAENQFAYCNRMRMSDYVKLFEDLGFTIERQENIVDQEAVIALREAKLKIDAAFSGHDQEELCSTSLRVLLGLKS